MRLGRVNREAKFGIVDPRPVKFGKEFGFVGVVGVGQGKRLSAATVKRFLEMHNDINVHDQVHTIGQHVPPQNLENIHIRFHMLFSEGLNYK
ncbi:MAG: hypothetical protein PVF14_07400 [Desulfobacterales bacterium]